MKRMLILIAAAVFAVSAGTVFAGECCKTAKAAGKTCEVCNPSSEKPAEEKAACSDCTAEKKCGKCTAEAAKSKIKADSCCGKAQAKGKACKHPCCVKAAEKGDVCGKCNS